MVLVSIFFFFESDPRRDHQQIVLYSFCRSMRLALHLAVKILLQIFLYGNLSTLALTYICPLYFPSRMPAGPHFVTQPILLSENIPNIDINHQQNTRRSDQIETIKTIMQTTRPRITWKGVLPMAQVAIFKNIRSSAKRFRLWIVLFWTKTCTTSHIIFTI